MPDWPEDFGNKMPGNASEKSCEKKSVLWNCATCGDSQVTRLFWYQATAFRQNPMQWQPARPCLGRSPHNKIESPTSKASLTIRPNLKVNQDCCYQPRGLCESPEHRPLPKSSFGKVPHNDIDVWTSKMCSTNRPVSWVKKLCFYRPRAPYKAPKTNYPQGLVLEELLSIARISSNTSQA